MKKEADSLLEASGVSLNWRMASENHGNETFAGLVVLKFKGKCKVGPWPQPGEPSGTQTLGETQDLRPEATRRERQRALGLALGRVVAHELYHILAHTTADAAHGLAKAATSLEDLVSERSRLALRAEDGVAIRQGLAVP